MRWSCARDFPKTKEDLFEYYAVVFDDIEAAFFSHEQMDLVRRFVAERGGGFLMLGGKDSFQHGGFDRTPIGSVLPVYLDPVPAADAPPATAHGADAGGLAPALGPAPRQRKG